MGDICVRGYAGKAGTVAIGDRDSGEVYSWDRGQKGTGTAGMVELVRWPSGTGTAEKYIAGTVAKRGRGQRVL